MIKTPLIMNQTMTSDAKKTVKSRAALLACLLMTGCQSTPERPETEILPEPSKVDEASADEPILIDISALRRASGHAEDEAYEVPDSESSRRRIETASGHWMAQALNDKTADHWQALAVSPGKSLRFFFKSQDVRMDWLDQLNKADYYKMSTAHDYQTFYVATHTSGAISKVYTKRSAFEWYFVQMVDGTPVFHETRAPEIQPRQVYMDKTSSWADLSPLQQAVIRDFFQASESELGSQALSILEKGSVRFFYQLLSINNLPVRHTLERVEASDGVNQLRYQPADRRFGLTDTE